MILRQYPFSSDVEIRTPCKHRFSISYIAISSNIKGYIAFNTLPASRQSLCAEASQSKTNPLTTTIDNHAQSFRTGTSTSGT